jgi:hypothetical protein
MTALDLDISSAGVIKEFEETMGLGGDTYVSVTLRTRPSKLESRYWEKRKFVTLELIRKETDIEPPFPLGPRTSCPLRAVKARSTGTTVNAGRFQIEPS